MYLIVITAQVIRLFDEKLITHFELIICVLYSYNEVVNVTSDRSLCTVLNIRLFCAE